MTALPRPQERSVDSEGRDSSTFKDRAPRKMTLLITGKLIQQKRESLCRVRNISATGMMIETRALIVVNQMVRVAMRFGGEIAARVAWTRDGLAGLAFQTPIDVEATLAPQPAQGRLSRVRAPRGPRLAAHRTIEIVARGVPHQVRLLDISQGGACLQLPFRPTPDERLIMLVPGLPPKSGAVRWLKDAVAGLGFYEPLPFDLLAEWAEDQGGQAGPGDEARWPLAAAGFSR
jgi:hypothetical protein